MSKWSTWTLEPQAPPAAVRAKRGVARALRFGGHWLAVVARRLHRESVARPQGAPVFEFYAEAGAPEGALFVDGQRIGVLKGVTRL